MTWQLTGGWMLVALTGSEICTGVHWKTSVSCGRLQVGGAGCDTSTKAVSKSVALQLSVTLPMNMKLPPSSGVQQIVFAAVSITAPAGARINSSFSGNELSGSL